MKFSLTQQVVCSSYSGVFIQSCISYSGVW